MCIIQNGTDEATLIQPAGDTPAPSRLAGSTAVENVVQRPLAHQSAWLAHLPPVAAVLRGYQRDLIERIRKVIREGHGRILVQAPTGAGKTHIMCVVAAAAISELHRFRVLILAPRTRIVRQIHERLKEFGLQHGVIAAELPGLRWDAALIQVAGVDTLHRRAIADARMPLPPADVVIFDEAHLALGDTRVELLESYPDAVHVGFTATPAKRSGRPLSDRFDVLVPGPTVRQLIDLKCLVPPRVFTAPMLTESELEAIPKDSKSGDYVETELQSAMLRPKLVGDVAVNWHGIAFGKRTLVFACSKSHAQALVQEFCQTGVAAELLTDDNSEREREAAIARLEAGQTTVIVNCFLMSYGIDIPSVECIVLARPTRSLTLYLQAVGRGMRPFPGKMHVLVIDHGRIVEALGLPHEEFPWSLDAQGNVNQKARRAAKERAASVNERPRTCPECSHMWLVSDEGPTCTHCGWAPAPPPTPIVAADVELQEVGVPATWHSIDAECFYAEALGWYRKRWPDRWASDETRGRLYAWHRTREALKLPGEKLPARYRTITPSPFSPTVAGKLHSHVIAYAKGQAKARARA